MVYSANYITGINHMLTSLALQSQIEPAKGWLIFLKLSSFASCHLDKFLFHLLKQTEPEHFFGRHFLGHLCRIFYLWILSYIAKNSSCGKIVIKRRYFNQFFFSRSYEENTCLFLKTFDLLQQTNINRKCFDKRKEKIPAVLFGNSCYLLK